RFIASNAQCMASSAPHIYISALPFSPSSSVLANHYLAHYPRMMMATQGKKAHWDAALLTIDEGNRGTVFSVSFSPTKGNHLVSGSADGAVCIWDIETAKVVVGPLQGHHGAVYSVAYSPDGLRILSGSSDKTIRVWNAE
ncbi:WD40-repeat-containing domain protein, partial [Mycena floridula]